MKIKAVDIKPGMLIGINRGSKFVDYSLVFSVRSRHPNVEYGHVDLNHAEHLIGSLEPNRKVKVIDGQQKKQIMQIIKNEMYKILHAYERDVETFNLIEAMEDIR